MISPTTFTTILNQLLPEPHASLVSGMLFGIKATMPNNFYQALKTTGTLHIIALSGTNITIIISIIGTLLLPLGRRIACLLTIFWIVLFVLFVGPSASVIRASLMGSMALIGLYLGRQRYGLYALVLAGIAMIVVNPAWAWDIGFQLSFLASLGIILVGGDRGNRVKREGKGNKGDKNKLKEIVDGLWRVLVVDVRTSLAAQLFTLPVIFFNFHQVSLVSPLTNVLVGWVVEPITVLGMAVALVGWLFFPLGIVGVWLLYPFVEYFIQIVNWTAHLPFAAITF